MKNKHRVLYVLLFLVIIIGASAYSNTNYSGTTVLSPAGYTLIISAWSGGGGGGAGGALSGNKGGGGGGGSFSSITINTTYSEKITLVAGAGGTGSATSAPQGNNGSSTVINSSVAGTIINITGGRGGYTGPLGAGGVAGVIVTAGSFYTIGGNGSPALAGTTGGGGGGAGSYQNGSNASTSTGGTAGSYFGGAGGNGGGSNLPGFSGSNLSGGGGGGWSVGAQQIGGHGGNGSINIISYNSTLINVNVYDESTLAKLSVTVNLTVSDLNNVLPDVTYSVISGSKWLDGYAGNYSFKFSGSGYSLRSYQVNTVNDTVVNLNAYLTTSTASTVFTIKDSSNSMGVENAVATMSRSLNDSFTTVESKFSDVTGSVPFTYVAGARYRFSISKTGYSSITFYLDPVVLTGYTIQLVPSSTASLNYDNIGIVLTPTSFYNDRQNNLTFTISSPDGVLSSYGINASYPSGNVGSAGVNANGGILYVPFNTSATTSAFDTVNITYYFTSVNTGYHEYNLSYSIRGGVAMGTFLRNQAERFGLGDFEAVLIATIFILMLGGAATYFGGSLIGGVLSLFMMGYMFYIGLFPLWSIILSMLAGFVFISWRSTA